MSLTGSSGQLLAGLLTWNRFVPEGKQDHVVYMLETMASECKAEVSSEATES